MERKVSVSESSLVEQLRSHRRSAERGVWTACLLFELLGVAAAISFLLLSMDAPPGAPPILAAMTFTGFNLLVAVIVSVCRYTDRKMAVVDEQSMRIEGPFFERSLDLDEVRTLVWFPRGCKFGVWNETIWVTFMQDQGQSPEPAVRWLRRAIPIDRQTGWETTAYQWLMSMEWKLRCSPPGSWWRRTRQRVNHFMQTLFVVAGLAAAAVAHAIGDWRAVPGVLIFVGVLWPLMILATPKEGRFEVPLLAPQLRPMLYLEIVYIISTIMMSGLGIWLREPWMSRILWCVVAVSPSFFWFMWRYDRWLNEWYRQTAAPFIPAWEAEWLPGPLPGGWPSPESVRAQLSTTPGDRSALQ